MKEYRVLVTGTSSYGVGEGILKVINNSVNRENIFLIGASNSNLTPYRHITDKYLILPNAKEEEYIERLKEVIETERVDILIPGSEAEMEVISKHKGLLKTFTDVWVNDYPIVDIFKDKNKAYNFFKDNGFTVPKHYDNLKKIDNDTFPLIVKPKAGKGSENIYIVSNHMQLEAVIKLFESYDLEYIIQEYIDSNDEYTVSLINLNEKHQEILIMKRILNKGATQYAYIEDNEEIKKIIARLHKIVKKEMILNIQIKQNNDNYFILEVNPRFSGSAPMRALLGFNEFDIIFSDKYLHKSLHYENKKEHYVIRGYKEFLYALK